MMTIFGFGAAWTARVRAVSRVSSRGRMRTGKAIVRVMAKGFPSPQKRSSLKLVK
jgi:hypothetical protein